MWFRFIRLGRGSKLSAPARKPIMARLDRVIVRGTVLRLLALRQMRCRFFVKDARGAAPDGPIESGHDENAEPVQTTR